jgi:hypothetical protein
MKRRTVLALPAAGLLAAALPAKAQASSYAGLLARHTTQGADGLVRVRYAALAASAADRAALDAHIAREAARAPSRMARAEAFAFWADLYNAVTLQVVLAAWPVRSIRSIRPSPLDIGPWKAKRVTVEGRRLSLDDIEHAIMRPTFRDPRVHYAVNCASIGCPNLKRTPWTGANLEADLDAAARTFINSPRGVALRPDGRLTVSSIYRWFREDFGGNDAGVLAHLGRYAAGDLKARIDAGARIGGDAYDWSINAAG